jgi:hypothetical protein
MRRKRVRKARRESIKRPSPPVRGPITSQALMSALAPPSESGSLLPVQIVWANEAYHWKVAY